MLYIVEAGQFNVKGNQPVFKDTEIEGISLVHPVYIGRAQNDDEQDRCDIGSDNPFHKKIAVVDYRDGKRIIIPQYHYPLTNSISKDHGQLALFEGDCWYIHRSRKGMGTRLWIPNKGVTNHGQTYGERLPLRFSAPSDVRYLLLGGKSEGDDLHSIFGNFAPYYVLVRQIASE